MTKSAIFVDFIPETIMGAYTEPVQPYMIEPKMTELLAENEKRKKKMQLRFLRHIPMK